MICFSVNRFFISNLLSLGLDSKLKCYSRRGDVAMHIHFCRLLRLIPIFWV